jgi:hypothetical protein
MAEIFDYRLIDGWRWICAARAVVVSCGGEEFVSKSVSKF